VRVLGPIEVAGEPLSPRLCRLIAALAAAPGTVVPVDQLAEAVWAEDQPKNAEAALHNLVARLRARLPGEAIVTRPPGYLLAAPTDAAEFEALTAKGRFSEALALWRGPAFAGVDVPAAEAEAARLEELRLGTIENLAKRELEDDPDAAIARLTELVSAHPWRERPHLLLMRALAGAGRLAEAVTVFTRFGDGLRHEFGVDPSPAFFDGYGQLLRTPPPAANPLVGRDADLATVLAALEGRRCVTLAGPGGVGKTRLAQQVEAVARAGYADGTAWCDLSTVEHEVVDLVTTVVGIRPGRGGPPRRALLDTLRSRHALLVLDNAEHVSDAVRSLVGDLVAACPDVAILVTSRERLDVPAEHVVEVRPLPTEAAVALFERRTGAAVDVSTVDDVTELCRRLDGLPLAIELAAGRMAAVSPAELLERLGWRFRLLHGRGRPARHRTLRSLVDWSYGLLDPPAQAAFVTLSVFAGSFDLAAAEALVEDGALRVTELVDRSMLVREPTGRYAMLETLRAFAREHLAESIRAAHARHYLGLAQRAAAEFHGPRHAASAATVRREIDELRAAHTWALTRNPATAVAILAALPLFADEAMLLELFDWAERTAAEHPAVLGLAAIGARSGGDLAGAERLARRALTAAPDPADPQRAYALYVLGDLTIFHGRFDELPPIVDAVAELRDVPEIRAVRFQVACAEAMVHVYGGSLDEAQTAAERLVAVAAADRDPVAAAWADYVWAEANADADPDEAIRRFERARRGGSRFLEGVALVSLASLRGRHGDPRLAAPVFRDVIAFWRGSGNWTQQWIGLRGVVPVLAAAGRDEDAAVLLAAVNAGAVPPYGADADRLAAVANGLAERLGADRFARAGRRGAAMPADAVIAYADTALSAVAKR